MPIRGLNPKHQTLIFGESNLLSNGLLDRWRGGTRQVIASTETYLWFPKIRDTILGVPVIRTIVFGSLYWGPLMLGNYHLEVHGDFITLRPAVWLYLS